MGKTVVAFAGDDSLREALAAGADVVLKGYYWVPELVHVVLFLEITHAEQVRAGTGDCDPGDLVTAL